MFGMNQAQTPLTPQQLATLRAPTPFQGGGGAFPPAPQMGNADPFGGGAFGGIGRFFRGLMDMPSPGNF